MEDGIWFLDQPLKMKQIMRGNKIVVDEWAGGKTPSTTLPHSSTKKNDIFAWLHTSNMTVTDRGTTDRWKDGGTEPLGECQETASG